MRIILKMVFKEQNVKICIGFKRITKSASSGHHDEGSEPPVP
jgi:hypothetical protein